MKKKLKIISFICILLSILVWIPNVFFQIASPLWILTFIFSIIGAVLGILAKKYILVIGNIVMFFSFFIIMFVGYYMNSSIL
ncbi:hypothetical protein FHP05_14750 [Cerasibacillus terrae]|uniref:Uncharacterized protein n=1 Tax=Cerasibacillus terrae TaxID=2498845 RepID=A0A5C8NG19_9BACI|nr:hypothetical protein FHP05_14750 [Cerasibacillus terrae]